MFHFSFELFHGMKFVFIIAWLTFNFRPGGKKFNPFGFVPNSVKKKYKKEKVQNPAIVGIYFQLLFRVQPPPPFLHICEKTSYPESFKLTKSQLSFFSTERKEKSTLNWTFRFKKISTSIIILRHPSNTNCSTKLSTKGTIIESTFNVSLDLFNFSVPFDFHFSLSLWCNRSTIIQKRKKKEEKKKKKRTGSGKSRRWSRTELAIRQSVLSQNIIASCSIDFTVGVYLSRDSKRNVIVLCFANWISIESSLHRFFKIGSIRRKVIGD